MSNSDENNLLGTVAAMAGGAFITVGAWKVSDAIRDFITSQDKAEARKLLQKALQCQQQSNDKEAINLFWESLKKDPTYSEAYNSIAWFYAIRNMSLTEAEKLAVSAIKLAQNPLSQAYAFDTLAEINLRQNKLAEAIVNFNRCLNIQKRFDSFYRLAWCYQLTNNTLEAYDCLKKAISLQGNYYSIDLYSRIGNVCLELGRYNESIQYFQIAFKASNQQTCFASNDWGACYPISHREILQIRRCQCLLSLGIAYYSLDNFENSKNYWEAAHQTFHNHPYPIINLACIAARLGNRDELRLLLEKLMPLVIDKCYALDPPNISNKVISFSETIIVEQILSQPTLEIHLDIVLPILRSYKKISEYIYRERLKAWTLRNSARNKSDNNVTNISISGSKIGGFSIGNNSDISSQISSQDSSNINPDSVTSLSKEVDDRINSIVTQNAEIILSSSSNDENKQTNKSNDFSKNDTQNSSLDSSTNTSKKQLKRNT